jgi:hypothetical protein
MLFFALCGVWILHYLNISLDRISPCWRHHPAIGGARHACQ